jgi:hypothetical protein
MELNKFFEKVSWKLHRVNFKFNLFSIKYDGSNSAGSFAIFSITRRLRKSSLLSWSFRLPNKTNVKRFVTDSWDFLFLRNYLYKRYESLIDKELWTVRGLTKTEQFKRRILSKLF